VGRRDEIIEVAATILREDGPAALTSVEVAARIGVTQSAIYRHIVDMDELAAAASRIVVSQMTAVLNSILLAPDADFDELSGIADLSRKLVHAMGSDAQVFEVIDRWRFAEGALGDGIRDTLTSARDLLIVILEREWRDEYGYTDPLTSDLTAVQRSHAEMIVDDVITVARLLRSGTPDRDAARLLQLRIVTGWVAYVADLQTRLGREVPEIEVA
jgi:AcrR family transcriptional regulator